MILSDRTWKLKYTPDDGDLVRLFYVPRWRLLFATIVQPDSSPRQP